MMLRVFFFFFFLLNILSEIIHTHVHEKPKRVNAEHKSCFSVSAQQISGNGLNTVVHRIYADGQSNKRSGVLLQSCENPVWIVCYRFNPIN